MTPQEHQLIIEMFIHQTLNYAALVEALKSRGVLDAGDLEAFDDVVSHTKRALLEQYIRDQYLAIGRDHGVTGLPES
jgi:hypothetical protein